MFTEFESIFNSDDKKITIPKSIMKQIGKELPEELEYRHIEDGICIIENKNGSPLQVGARIKLPDIPTDIMKNLHSFNELYEYLYRTQKECEMIPNKNGSVIINGNDININSFIKYIYSNGTLKRIIMRPEAFPEPVKVNIKAGNTTKQFHLKREPFESMDVILIKSTEVMPIEIELYIKENNTANFKINIKIDNITDVKEIVEICDFYENFLYGNIQIEGMELTEIGQISRSVSANESIDFWNKALKLEKKLDKKFNAMKLFYKDYDKINELYTSLIDGKSFNIKDKIEAINSNNINIFEQVKAFAGKTMDFEYEHEELLNLGEQELKLFKLERIHNYYVKDIILLKDEVKILVDAKENSSIIAKYFLTEDDMQKGKEFSKQDN